MSPVRVLCAQCGAALSPDGRFCVACGAPVGAITPSGNVAPPEGATGVKAQMLKSLRDATLGEYEILLELGSGGMATVYLAHDLQLDRRVAIKLMHPTLTVGSDMVERFILEARTAASLSHPNIIPIYAVKVQEDLLYFVMKYVEGRPLDSIIKSEAPLGTDMVRQIVTQVADALAYAHRHGVIHRDIKPANIIISTDGNPILADFGIAKVADKPGLTLTGATIGTPTYMSPEQCDAQPVTGASDQYSLGVTAYEALTGKPPFDAPSYLTIMMKQMTVPAPPLSAMVKDCPPDLSTTIDRMLAKEPGDRFATMDEVVEALRTATVSSQHTVRTQLVQFALADPRRELVKRVSTPQSPIPTAARRPRVAPDTSTTTGIRKPSRTAVVAGALIVGLAAGALMFGRPWSRAPRPIDSAAARVPAPAPVAAAPADSGATAVAAPPERLPAPAGAATRTPPTKSQQAVPSPERTAPAAVSAIRVTGPETLSAGSSGSVLAEIQDSKGQPVTGRTVAWSSSATDVLSVGPAGQLQAVRPGRAVITAALDGVSRPFTVTVIAEPVSGVTVAPATLSLAPGESASLEAQVAGSGGRVLDRQLDWSSSAPAVATVTPSGRVSAVAPGSAVISAASGGKTGTSAVTVSAPAPEAAPSDAERRAQITATIATYAQALQSRNLARVRELYPTVPASVEQSLSGMDDLQVRLNVGQVDFSEAGATAQVTGSFTYRDRGKREVLPANNRYRLERRGTGWVITEIR